MEKDVLFYQVKNMLKLFPETRNSDITLTKKLWNYYFSELIVDGTRGEMIYLDDLFELPREDNIKRIRAKIQNEQHLYLPTDMAVMIKRAKNSKEWRQFLGYQNYWQDGEWTNAIINFLQPKQGSLI